MTDAPRLAVRFDDDRTTYRPGETVRGRALWLYDKAPERIEVRLFWLTVGKGDSDLGIADTVEIDCAGAPAGDQPFALQLPDRPWSFVGKLITLNWAVEIVSFPREEAEDFGIAVGPAAATVNLLDL